MIVSEASISGDRGSCQKGSKSAPILITLTHRHVREGFVDGEHVARCVVRGLFWGLQRVVRDDVVPRVDTLPGPSAPGKLRKAKTR